MNQSKKALRHSLWASAIAILLCGALLFATTFAWFTDSKSSTGNKIESGKLSITATVADWTSENPATTITDSDDKIKNTLAGEGITVTGLTFGTDRNIETAGPIINATQWEPNRYDAKLLTIKNDGNLWAKVKIDFSTSDNGLEGALRYDFVQVENNQTSGNFTLREMSTLPILCDMTELPVEPGKSLQFILVYGMDKDAGNSYQNKSFASTVTIIAKQYTQEEDGFGSNQYDANATYPVVVTATQPVTSTTVSNTTTVATAVTIRDSSALQATATVPAGVKLENENVSSLTLSINEKAETASGITVQPTQASRSFEVNVSGVASDNTTPITVQLKIGTGLDNVVVYHNGSAMENSAYNYDSNSGIVTINTTSFSPFDVLYDSPSSAAMVNGNTYDSFMGAIDASNGGTVYMLKNNSVPSKTHFTSSLSVDLSGKTLTMGDNVELKNGSNLVFTNGTVLRETYSGYVDVRPGATTNSTITYTGVHFTNNYKTKTYGPCTDRVESAVEFCPENNGAASFVFKDCTFDNSQVLFEGLSGTTGNFTAIFENCTFNNLGTSAGIEVANYLTGNITVKNCIFNITATASAKALSVSNSCVQIKFEGANYVNGYAATASGEDGSVDQIKVMNPSVKVYSINTNSGSTVEGLDTVTVSGIAQ